MSSKTSQACTLLFGTALFVLALTYMTLNLHNLKSDNHDTIPLNSILHGVMHQKLPMDYFNCTGCKGALVEDDPYLQLSDFIGLQESDSDYPFQQTSQIAVMTGETVHVADDSNLQFKVNYTLEKHNEKPLWNFDNPMPRHKGLIIYAMGCATWESQDLATPLSFEMKNDDTQNYSPACKCVADSYTAWTAAGDTDTTGFRTVFDKEPHEFEKRTLQFCLTRNYNKYNVEYAGEVNTKGLIGVGHGFLLAATFLIWLKTYVIDAQLIDEKYLSEKTARAVCLVGAGFLLFWFSFYEYGRGWTNLGTHMEDDAELWETRSIADLFQYPQTGSFVPNTSDKNSTPNLIRLVAIVGFCVWGLLALVNLLMQFDTVASYTKIATEKHENDALYRFLVDVPIIVGFVISAVSVLVQNGYTNYNYLDINIFLVFTICFLQHMSNVVKIIYDEVCAKTNSKVFEQLYFDKAIAKDFEGYDIDKDDITKKRETAQNNKVTYVLQFFGWFRVWIFLLVTLGTVVFITMTKELVHSTSISSMFNNQMLVFALVLYLSNVGYDVVRELLPVEFQKYSTDSTRFMVLTVYIAYYHANQYYHADVAWNGNFDLP